MGAAYASHGLWMCVVAEGVETGAQMRLLQSLGCVGGQGYYFFRPLAPGDYQPRAAHALWHADPGSTVL